MTTCNIFLNTTVSPELNIKIEELAQWVRENMPGEKYLLKVWDHGASVALVHVK